MFKEQLAELTKSKRNRLALIKLRVRFIGEVRRQDLAVQFDAKSASATQDLTLYKELDLRNIDYEGQRQLLRHGPGLQALIRLSSRVGVVVADLGFQQWRVDVTQIENGQREHEIYSVLEFVAMSEAERLSFQNHKSRNPAFKAIDGKPRFLSGLGKIRSSSPS